MPCGEQGREGQTSSNPEGRCSGRAEHLAALIAVSLRRRGPEVSRRRPRHAPARTLQTSAQRPGLTAM